MLAIDHAPGFIVPAASGGQKRTDDLLGGIGWHRLQDPSTPQSTLYYPLEGDPVRGIRWTFAGDNFDWEAAGFGYNDANHATGRSLAALGLRQSLMRYTGVLLKLHTKEAVEQVRDNLLSSPYRQHLINPAFEGRAIVYGLHAAHQRSLRDATALVAVADAFNQPFVVASFTRPQVAGEVPPIANP